MTCRDTLVGSLGQNGRFRWDFSDILARFHGDFKGNFKGNVKDLDIWSDAVALKKNLQEFGISIIFK